MGYEIDLLSVGTGDCSGDAIAFRFGNLNGQRSEQGVVIVDGGYQESGQNLVELVKDFYKTDTVDLVISTHPDNDHSSGLAVVLDELTVGRLIMHKPWEHTDEIAKMFRDGRVTDQSVAQGIRKSLDSVRELERIANRRGIPITEPFAGTSFWNAAVTIVGPTTRYYESLLPDFRCTPPARKGVIPVVSRVAESIAKAVTWAKETLDIETLTDDGVTHAENNSSAIVLIVPEAGHALLLTADAGIPALTGAADYLAAIGFDFNSIKFIQVPHHGSRRNVGPTILNRLLGPKRNDEARLRAAYVSAGTESAPKHPAKKVTNAFRRRGAHVYGTMDGNNIRYQHNAPARAGYGPLDPLPLYMQVEESSSEAA
jgi:beta-lactamase superfamily II metal-dependent hydrolase